VFREATDRWTQIAAAHEGPLAAVRAPSLDDFRQQGFPDTQREEWRYTNLVSLLERTHEFVTTAIHLEGTDQAGVTALDFATDPGLSQLSGLDELVDRKSHPLAALNGALLSAGVSLSVARGAQLTEAINVTLPPLARGTAHAARVLARVGENASAKLHIGEAPSDETCWRNDVVEVFLERGAQLELVFHKSGGAAATSLLAIRQERDSHLSSHAVTLEGRLTRQDLAVTLAGEGASCRLRGLFGTTEGGVCDHHSVVDHAVPHCTSDQLYKGVVAGDGRGVFRGRVVVRPDAQKTEALQSNPNLLLDGRAEVDTKPQLEIYADDVRCTHGATIGQLDREALFYLRARGIGAPEARRLLVRGFASEALAGISDEALRERLLRSSLARLGEGS
jgi:Fe-S cluster assembly protein SufD